MGRCAGGGRCNNPENVKIVFKNFPLRRHKYATKAAMAALAADGQGKFWQFHDRLFKNYKQLSDQKIKDIARDLGFDIEKFEKQMKDPGILAQIRQDMLDGNQAGVRGTPTVFIGGRLLRNWSPKEFQKLIDKELGRTKQSPGK
ncbi:MAG: thioredoxin domain-containing protein [Deltaproteobacteria bacterium]|nr:thioredoxin domain-containing protein [Deltaproteobacteria bacterium]